MIKEKESDAWPFVDWCIYPVLSFGSQKMHLNFIFTMVASYISLCFSQAIWYFLFWTKEIVTIVHVLLFAISMVFFTKVIIFCLNF